MSTSCNYICPPRAIYIGGGLNEVHLFQVGSAIETRKDVEFAPIKLFRMQVDQKKKGGLV